MRFVLFAHGGSGNHGCEALVRSTCKIIRSKYKDAEIVVATYCKSEDLKYGITGVQFVEYNTFSAIDPIRYIDKICRTIFKIGLFRNRIVSPVNKMLKSDDVCLSIGGDNYSYDNVIPFDIIAVHNAAKKCGCRTILWGCSINKKNLTGKILNDLRNYDCIVARESITYSDLLEAGLDESKVKLGVDPAFLLDVSDTAPLINGEIVGINLSPVVMEDESKDGIVTENYYKLIEYILNSTTYNVFLIPHVVWNNSNDYFVLKKLYEKYKDTGRITLVEDSGAEDLKAVIGKCSVFVGARTHSTIAAYSQCVPTLVLGYSVKARGIARDIFGREDGYVIPTQNLATGMDLTNAFIKIEKNKQAIESHLRAMMDDYKAKALKTGEYLFENNK